MDLIIGGAFQGKLEYAKEHFGIAESDVFRCERTAIIDHKARCIYGLEDYVYGCIKEGTEPILDFAPDAVLIGREVFSGVVPMDAEVRRFREEYGRYLQKLASRCTTVTRMFCGLPQRIK